MEDLQACRTSTQGVLTRMILHRVSVTLCVIRRLFRPFLAVRVNDDHASVNRRIPFTRLTHFRRLLGAITSILVRSGNMQASRSQRVRYFTKYRRNRKVLHNDPQGDDGEVIFME